MAIRPPVTQSSNASVGCGTSRGTNAAARKMAEPRMVPAVIAVTSHNPSALTRARDSGSLIGWVSTTAAAANGSQCAGLSISALYLVRTGVFDAWFVCDRGLRSIVESNLARREPVKRHLWRRSISALALILMASLLHPASWLIAQISDAPAVKQIFGDKYQYAGVGTVVQLHADDNSRAR